VAEVKASESDAGFNSELEPERGIWIIDVEPSATVATTKLQPGEPNEPKEGEQLFHSQMWVKGTPIALHRGSVVARITSSHQYIEGIIEPPK
jgi:hypothetical protein